MFDEKPTGDVRGVFHLKIVNCRQYRNQGVVSNGETSELRKINSGDLQGSALGPPLFLICTNDLPDGLISICKIFADDTSIYSKIFNINESASDFHTDLEK